MGMYLIPSKDPENHVEMICPDLVYRFLRGMICIVALFFVFWPSKVHAQSVLINPEMISFGNAGSAGITGFASQSVNPANLMLMRKDYPFQADIINISSNVGGELFNVHLYNRYLTRGRVLTAPLQQEMLSRWFSSDYDRISSGGFNAGLTTFGFAHRREHDAISVGHQIRVLGRLGSSRGVFEAAFGGLNDELFEQAKPVNLRYESMIFMQFSAAYARSVFETEDGLFGYPTRIFAGVAPAVNIGTHHLNFKTDGTLQVSGDSLITHSFSYKIRSQGAFSRDLERFALARQELGADQVRFADYAGSPFEGALRPSGYGLSLNAGLNAEITLPQDFFFNRFTGTGPRTLRFSISVADWGSIFFTESAATYTNQRALQWRGVDINDDRIDSDYNGNIQDYLNFVLRDSIGTDKYLGYAITGGSYRADLPSTLSLGSYFRAGKLRAMADIHTGFNSVGLNSRRLLFATGFGYQVHPVLQLRTGFSAGSRRSPVFAGGIVADIGNAMFHISFSSVSYGNPGGTSASFSFGSRVRF
ncbi:MAG: DUF5723 family protein [Balneolales bacterium]|nr:DUF5723 family protein [Balneolales bacterium]